MRFITCRKFAVIVVHSTYGDISPLPIHTGGHHYRLSFIFTTFPLSPADRTAVSNGADDSTPNYEHRNPHSLFLFLSARLTEFTFDLFGRFVSSETSFFYRCVTSTLFRSRTLFLNDGGGEFYLMVRHWCGNVLQF